MARADRVRWLAVPWALLSVPLLLLFAAALPAVHARRLTPSPQVRAGLDQLGLSSASYAAWWTGVQLVFGVVCFAVAALIAVRRPRERAAWSTALLLVALGAANAPNTEALAWHRPALEPVAAVASQLLLASLVLFLFTFPDGRSHPRWGWVVVPVTVAAVVLLRGPLTGPPTDALFWALLAGLATGTAAQVHRYRRVSTAERRQQTRWVVCAAAVAVAAQLLFPLLESVPALARPGAGAALLDMASPAGISLGYGLIAVSLAVALLRSRLWDLDVVVNRALVYGCVTVALLVLYVGVVAGLGAVSGRAGGAGGSVVAAAVVALLLAPLRERTQRGVNRLMYGQRDEPYRVLSRLSRRLESSVAPRAALGTIVETVASALRSPYVALAVQQRDGTLAIAAETPGPRADTVVLPLVHGSQPVGELRVAPRSPSESFGPADRALLEDLGRHAGAAVHTVQLADALQQSRERLVTAREEERRRLRRDLHDGLGPALASMTLQAEAACELVDAQPEVARTVLSDLVLQLQSSTADIRRLVYDLRPPALDDLGLAEALRVFLSRSRSDQVRLDLHVPGGLPPLSAAAEVAVYRIVQESVLNVLRHARASSCTVVLRTDDEHVEVEVRDDGIGIGLDVPEGVGLRSMRERAAELGGTCSVARTPGRGAQVHVRLPRAVPAGVHG